MFEQIFADAIYNKASHDSNVTRRATEINMRVRRENPTMITIRHPNLVDFSNPESVARMQSPILHPYGTYKPELNPNIRPPSMNNQLTQQGYTVYSNPNNTVSGYSYRMGCSMDNLSATDTAKFMIPDPSNKRIPIGAYDVPKPPKPHKFDGLTYSEKKLLPAKVSVVRGCPQQAKKRERKIEIQYNTVEYREGIPYTEEELNPHNRYIKVVVETPLHWTSNETKELIEVLDRVYTYDIALAVVTVELVAGGKKTGFDKYTREQYERMIEYLNNKYEEFKQNEIKFRNIIDYRAPYRYRPVPIHELDANGEYIIPIQEESIAKFRRDPETGEKIYTYDRKRSWLTEDEWEVFKLRAFDDMMRGMEKIKMREFLELNKHLYEEPIKQEKEPELPAFNPADSISVKLHKMRTAEKEYQMHRNFFRFLLRHTMNDVEFDNWWYGTNSQRPNTPQEDPKQKWAREMHNRHLQFLHTLQPVNYAQQGAICRQMMIQRLREFDKGLETPDMSLTDSMALWGYLGVVRPMEINIERQQREKAELRRQSVNRERFMQNMYHNVNNLAKNPNPQYVPKYGSIDPRYNMPSHYVDLTQNEQSQQTAKVVYQSAANMGRHPRLHTLYK